ncbi:hypothetical protein MAR_005720 [Mya arenaria]|uniref:Uncharacterized protein n=1 Tax=Mya arenaria TaxID=6604 RepID=A0ABY7F0B0_MYAAR|nr:hypothetical protein MAR_005720 [Mya arenaria]
METRKLSSRKQYNQNHFWKLEWRMFGGRFMNFMCGYKNQRKTMSILRHWANVMIPNGKNLKVCRTNSSKLQKILLKSLRNNSAGILQANALKKKKKYAKEKLVEKGGGLTWKESKFAYAISVVLGYNYDIEKYLMTAEKCIRSICLCLSSLNGATYISDVNVNLEKGENYIPLKMQIQDIHNTRLIPQRTDKWFEVRKCAKVTGSTLYKALGLDGLKKQKEYFEHIKCNLPEQEVSEQAKLNMQHGTLNEENAVATIISKIMPIFTVELVFFEEGCVQVFDEDAQPFLVVFPDGSLRESESFESTKVAV